MATPNDKIGGVPLLTYLDLTATGRAGRGGCVRFFMLAAGIEFTEDVVPLHQWFSSRKQELISSGVNPAGTLPVVSVGSEHLVEHYAILRRFARQLGLYGVDVARDYAADVVAEAVVPIRADIITAAFGDAAAKEAYAAKRMASFTALQALVKRMGGATNGHAVASDVATYADFLVFAALHDDMRTIDRAVLEAPVLSDLRTLYDAMLAAYPPVAAWVKQQDDHLAAAAAAPPADA